MPAGRISVATALFAHAGLPEARVTGDRLEGELEGLLTLSPCASST
jgi:hypothetical protein